MGASELGPNEVDILRTTFVRRNRYDYALYAHARTLAKRRVAACGRVNAGVEALRRTPAEEFNVDTSTETTTPFVEMTVDDLFGCSGGSLEATDNGTYILICPRSATSTPTLGGLRWHRRVNRNGSLERRCRVPSVGMVASVGLRAAPPSSAPKAMCNVGTSTLPLRSAAGAPRQLGAKRKRKKKK